MVSPIPAFWQIPSGGFFLAALLLAAPNALMASKPPPPPQIQELDDRTAARLLVHVVKPDYPSIAKVNFIRGAVKLKVKVTSEGRVSDVHVIEGEPILAAAAFKSVRKWLYRPYVSEDGPTPFSSYVTVKFDLHPLRYRQGQFPQHANEYLEKQVRPPEIISQPQQGQSAVGIPMKVLVGSKGEVVDATSMKAGELEIDLARKSLQSWKFRPARWGSLAVPWYVTVTVPLPYVALDQTANSTKH
ncbi:MAG TPA: energy transducer TonB [Terriglobia bacterium]|nr:energy transducer TonB [Terriglobia bacterium]